MKKTVLFRALPLLALLGLMCTGVWAQSSVPYSPKAGAESYQEMKLAQKAALNQTSATKVKASQQSEVEAYKVENIKSLYNEMKANVNNPSYDMATSLKKLQNSKLVDYPLSHFDPQFPLVIKTGDLEADKLQYNKAKQAYLKSQQ